MAPTLILIRHAQALHNVANDWSLHDPPLSKLGEEQCAELQEALKKESIADKVELIVVSAQRRTLQTAMLSLTWLIEDKKIPIFADAGWQGRYRVASCKVNIGVSSAAVHYSGFCSKISTSLPRHHHSHLQSTFYFHAISN